MNISQALNDEFKVYLPNLIPQVLGVLHSDRSPKRQYVEGEWGEENEGDYGNFFLILLLPSQRGCGPFGAKSASCAWGRRGKKRKRKGEKKKRKKTNCECRAAQKVLHALEIFGNNLDDYLHLVIPAVVRLFEHVDTPTNVRIFLPLPFPPLSSPYCLFFSFPTWTATCTPSSVLFFSSSLFILSVQSLIVVRRTCYSDYWQTRQETELCRLRF